MTTFFCFIMKYFYQLISSAFLMYIFKLVVNYKIPEGFIYGKYLNIENNCEKFEFLEDGSFKHILCCQKFGNRVITEEDCSNLKFEIDSEPKDNIFFITTFSKTTGECLNRYHLNFDYPRLIITPLKPKLNNIDHFTQPIIFIDENYFGKNSMPDFPKMEIYIPVKFSKDFFYIAYDQNTFSNNVEYRDEVIKVIVPISGLIKTNLYPDTRIYAYNNYYAFFIDGNIKSRIPIISENELQRLDTMNSLQQKKFFIERGIYHNSKYLIPCRFNPDRERVVNKVFGERIKGQVQEFYLKKYK